MPGLGTKECYMVRLRSKRSCPTEALDSKLEGTYLACLAENAEKTRTFRSFKSYILF